MTQQYTSGWLSLDAVHMKLSQVDFPTNAEITDDDSGSLYAEVLALTGYAPVATGTTPAINSLLSNIGIGGTCIIAGGSILVGDVTERALGTCDTPLGGTPHYRKRVTRGLIIPTSLSAARNADANLNFEMHTFTDTSGNDPVAITDGVISPATVVAERYRLAISKIAGIQFPEIEDVTITFGVDTLPKEPKLANVAPLTSGILTIRPEITLRGRDLSRVKTAVIDQTANATTHANTVIQLARIEDGASFYAAGTSNHITITAYGVTVPANLGSGSARSRATNELTLTCGFDGTNAPLVVTYNTSYNTNP